MFVKIFKNVSIQVVSTCLFMLGNGLTNTAINLKINTEDNESSLMVGIITSIYFLGMLLSAFKVSSLILKIGHIRAYSSFAAVFAVSMLVPILSDNIYLLMGMRLLSGYCIGVLYITIESWLLTISTLKDRGKYLSFYIISGYGGYSLSQVLLKYTDYDTAHPLCLSAIFVCLSIIPITIAGHKSLEYEKKSVLGLKDLFKSSPTGMIGCLISGMIGAAIYGLIPIYYDDLHYSDLKIGNFMAATILGGMLLQYPLGLLSDQLDRRFVLIGICAASFCIALVIMLQRLVGAQNDTSIVILLFVFGGVAFSIYPISMSHACDVLDQEHLVEATQGLMLAYGVGSVLGPVTSSFFMRYIGPTGLFVSFLVYNTILTLFFLYRIFLSTAPKAKDKQEFVAVPTTTPVSTELDPRAY